MKCQVCKKWNNDWAMTCVSCGAEIVVSPSDPRAEKVRVAREKHAEQIRSLRLVQNGQYLQASQIANGFHARQARKYGDSVDLSVSDERGPLALVQDLFSLHPGILAEIPRDALVPFRVAAAMQEIWGDTDCDQWLPKERVPGFRHDNATIARMLLFAALHKYNLWQYQHGGVVTHVKILPAKRPCSSCLELSRKQYSLDKVPELPNPKCTHELGCRCTHTPVI